METAKIIGFSVLAAVVYGIVHDLFTANLCVEYFTVAHPPVFGALKNPILLALGWGTIATWWVGAILGILLSFAARLGRHSQWTVRRLVKPICRLLAVMAAIATLSWLIGWWLAAVEVIRVNAWFNNRIPAERHARFVGDAAAHLASYAVGALGGFILCAWVLRRRFLEERARIRGMPDSDASNRQ